MTLVRCPGVDGEGCEAMLAPGRDRCNFCRRDLERLNPDPTERDPMNDTTFEARQQAVLAKALRDADREDLAIALEQGAEPKADEQPKAPKPTEAEAFLAELKDKQEAPWTSAGKLLG